MSALRVPCWDCSEPVHPHPVLLDLGPAAARGLVMGGGRLARPESTVYRADSSSSDRVRRFREKHGGRVAR